MATLYKGFSTVDRQFPPFSLTNVDLIRRDLINHFLTRKGERVMLPNFGSRIHDMLMEPLDDLTRNIILDDVAEVIGQEPRVELQNTNLVELDHSIRLEVELLFLPDLSIETLQIEFDRRAEDRE
jgi:phage baseplate assembly protein W